MEQVCCNADWLGKDIEKSKAWIHLMSESEIVEIQAALARSNAKFSELGKLNINNFPLPRFSKVLARSPLLRNTFRTLPGGENLGILGVEIH